MASVGSRAEVGLAADGNDMIDAGDYAICRNLLQATEPLPGDCNNNGTVDAADYVVWRKGLGTAYTQADYNVWRTHFGQPPGSGSSASANTSVPEPATFVLLTFAVTGWSLRRGRAA